MHDTRKSLAKRLRWQLGALMVLPTLLAFESMNAQELRYNFEQTDSTVAVDSGGMAFDAPFLGTSIQTSEVAKFGEGSLALGDGPLMGFSMPLTGFDQLADEITRMTVTVWLKVKTYSAGDELVYILQRLDGSFGPGRFTFTYSGSSKRFSFAMNPPELDGNASAAHSEPTPAWEEEEWIHVAMTFDKGEVAYYFNGEMVGNPSMMSDGADLIPSVSDATRGVLRGLISSPGISHVDDFGYFTGTALSPEAIASIYQKGLDQFKKGE